MVSFNRSRMRAGLAALVAGVAVGLTGVAAVAPEASAMQMQSDRSAAQAWADRYNERLVKLVNRRRANHGLSRVRATGCANTHARAWSGHLTRADRFEHSNLGRLLDGCDANYASENIAMLNDGARPVDLVRMWMDSPGHRANILSRKARLTGVSVRWDDNQCAWVAVQNFVRK